MTTSLTDRSVRLAAQDGDIVRVCVNIDDTVTFYVPTLGGRAHWSRADAEDVRDLLTAALADAALVDPASPPPGGARVP